MKKILGILPHSIGGRLTILSVFDGFRLNGFEVVIFDELKNDNFNDYINTDYSFIVGYDFSAIKLKYDYLLKIPLIAYFSDDINLKTAGVGYIEYRKFLFEKDNYIFYWDRELAKKENLFYQPHFVNCEIYKELKPFSCAFYDVSFMGRLDSDLRLRLFLELNKKLKKLKFSWHAIEKHYLDALSRCQNEEEKRILKNTYCGFIDNEKDMASAINNTKIIYNINAQGISSLNYRSFQVMACKRLLISDKRAELDLFDNIIPYYENFDDLVNKIGFYLSDSDEYKKIASKGLEYIKLNHNSKECVKRMLQIIKGLN